MVKDEMALKFYEEKHKPFIGFSEIFNAEFQYIFNYPKFSKSKR